jgi:hypothetical protein
MRFFRRSGLDPLFKILESKFVVGVDYDGTTVSDRFPLSGKPIPGAIEGLKKLKELGGFIIIWSARNCPVNVYTAKLEGVDCLKEMEEGLKKYNIPYDFIDRGEWGKIKADFYIDNSAIPRFHLDWNRIVSIIESIVKEPGYRSSSIERWKVWLEDKLKIEGE